MPGPNFTRRKVLDEPRQSVTGKQSGHNRDSKGRFGPGNKGGGRPKGVPNKLTQNMKNLIQDELVRLGPNDFHAWALENPTEFY